LYGLSQSELADKLDITFQQLQKYETGNNRMSASRIWQASRVLGVPVTFFFEGLDGKSDPAADILNTRAGLELVRDFEACTKEVRSFASSLALATAGCFDAPPKKSSEAR
jgi:transcriptional regulator with XRE-family HTH domain